jgi:hypothetical protein
MNRDWITVLGTLAAHKAMTPTFSGRSVRTDKCTHERIERVVMLPDEYVARNAAAQTEVEIIA